MARRPIPRRPGALRSESWEATRGARSSASRSAPDRGRSGAQQSLSFPRRGGRRLLEARQAGGEPLKLTACPAHVDSSAPPGCDRGGAGGRSGAPAASRAGQTGGQLLQGTRPRRPDPLLRSGRDPRSSGAPTRTKGPDNLGSRRPDRCSSRARRRFWVALQRLAGVPLPIAGQLGLDRLEALLQAGDLGAAEAELQDGAGGSHPRSRSRCWSSMAARNTVTAEPVLPARVAIAWRRASRWARRYSRTKPSSRSQRVRVAWLTPALGGGVGDRR